MTITQRAVPKGALIAPFVDAPETHTDCFEARVPGQISLPQFITAFYTTPLFRAERAVLQIMLKRRISDAEVAALAAGADTFAAWTVEARSPDQILLADTSGRTKSWLQATPDGDGTRLRFGSVVVPVGDPPRLGAGIRAMMGAHLVYARLLLGAALRRLSRAV